MCKPCYPCLLLISASLSNVHSYYGKTHNISSPSAFKNAAGSILSYIYFFHLLPSPLLSSSPFFLFVVSKLTLPMPESEKPLHCLPPLSLVTYIWHLMPYTVGSRVRKTSLVWQGNNSTKLMTISRQENADSKIYIFYLMNKYINKHINFKKYLIKKLGHLE